MARITVRGDGILDVLKDSGVAAMLADRMQAALSAAEGAAPVESGAYRASLRTWTEEHPSRVVAHMGADVPYAMVVEADKGVLARALDAAGGRS